MASGTIYKIINDSDSNYCKMPDGTLIQWGSATVNSEGSYILSLPVAFIATPTITVSTDAWNPVAAGAAGVGTGTITLRSSANQKVYWQAIGRWK